MNSCLHLRIGHDRLSRYPTSIEVPRLLRIRLPRASAHVSQQSGVKRRSNTDYASVAWSILHNVIVAKKTKQNWTQD